MNYKRSVSSKLFCSLSLKLLLNKICKGEKIQQHSLFMETHGYHIPMKPELYSIYCTLFYPDTASMLT